MSLSASTSSSSSGFLGVRKRVDSSTDDPFSSVTRKRPRMSAMAGPFACGESMSIGEGEDRLIRPRSLFSEDGDIGSCSFFSTRRPRLLSSSSSFTAGSLSASLSADRLASPPRPARTAHHLVRSLSSSSLPVEPFVQQYPESSAKYHLQNGKNTIDYSRPNPPDEIPARLLGCSLNNIAFFTRGNRVYFKNLNTNAHEDVTQLYKLSDSRGNLRAIECGDKSLPDVLAVGTSKGYIQIWDIRTRKMTMTWPTTKDISAMAWNGPVLTVGGAKGTIRYYDTRISPVEKMREQARKITRHQGQITCLGWNEDGRLLASGDSTGMVHCWETGQMVPLNVGEFVQRRKKIQHEGGISAICWSPWASNLLATGDTSGMLRVWNINAQNPQSNASGKLDTGAAIKGLHFSPHCKEILTTHGDSTTNASSDTLAASKPNVANSLSVYSSSSLRHVSTFRMPMSKAVGDSVLNASGTKVIFTVPEDGKINVCDVWAKRKEVKRQASFTSGKSLLIR